MSNNRLADSEWVAFMAKLEAAEEKFVRGHPAAFKVLWSHADDVTLCGAFGRVERGWKNVAAGLDLASSKYSDGTRSRKEVSGTVGADLAYIVQAELIRSRLNGRTEESSLDLRVTMVFRR
jgi:hypothetical protein